MSNSQLYPFERNRYYPGKLLTSADFQAEQNYHINKGRFLNGLMYGSGVICGMGVFSLDDLSILIESGVAIDGGGREIILDTSVVKKISAIEGFDKLESSTATLKIRYKEQDVHSVYSVSHKEDDSEYEYNRVSEGCELFLADKDTDNVAYSPETEFLTRETLFKSENYSGEIMMPATVCKGRNVKIVLEIKKLSDADVRLSCRGILEIPAFNTADGESELEISAEDVSLEAGESIRKEYWVRVLDNDMEESELILRSGSATAFEDENAINSASHFSLRVRLSHATPLELVGRETGRINLEMRNMELTDDAISLADIKLVKNAGGSYIVESVTDSTEKNYILTPAQEMMRNDYLSYYEKDAELKNEKAAPSVRKGTEEKARRREFTNIASGTLEVPLGRNAREGDIRYSGEIAHGLGSGNVYVEIGYDFVSDDPNMGANQKSTIYGNPALFSQQNSILADVETSVKVLNEKGSFVVAARLLRNVDYLVLSFRWVAIRFPSGDDLEFAEDYYDKSISVDTPTVIMGTKESHFFGVRFNNMKNCSITYELTNPGSGEISSDGIYTAPSREGVYEIRIYCTDMPVICTYAYAIVKKKMLDEPEREDPISETVAEAERSVIDIK